MNHGQSAPVFVVGYREDDQFHAAVIRTDIDQSIADDRRAPGMSHGGEDARVADPVTAR